jgi:hypothetical protein
MEMVTSSGTTYRCEVVNATVSPNSLIVNVGRVVRLYQDLWHADEFPSNQFSMLWHGCTVKSGPEQCQLLWCIHNIELTFLTSSHPKLLRL